MKYKAVIVPDHQGVYYGYQIFRVQTINETDYEVLVSESPPNKLGEERAMQSAQQEIEHYIDLRKRGELKS